MRKKSFMSQALSLLVVMYFWGCSTFPKVKQDPFYESFYKTVRLIMTGEEKEIYKILRDRESKAEFIEEFWKIRDPDPATDENENKLEFEERIRFANEWFDKYKSSGKGRRKQAEGKSRGWVTERGRIYVILGPPDKVNYGSGWETMDMRRQNILRHRIEIWYYAIYNLTIGFSRKSRTNLAADPLDSSALDDMWKDSLYDEWSMDLDSKVLYALEDAKLNMIASQFRGDVRRAFRFEAEFKDDFIKLIIPTNRLDFLEKEGKLVARFDIKINIYKDHRKMNTIKESRAVSLSEREALSQDIISFEIPCALKEKGKYLLDIIVTDLKGGHLSKYRLNIKHKV